MVHVKDFSLLSPLIQSSEVFKAIETAIPAEAIEKAIANTKVSESRKRALPAQLVGKPGNSHEPVALGLDARRTQESN